MGRVRNEVFKAGIALDIRDFQDIYADCKL